MQILQLNLFQWNYNLLDPCIGSQVIISPSDGLVQPGNKPSDEPMLNKVWNA